MRFATPSNSPGQRAARHGRRGRHLSRYDSDGNHWIDENDEVYDQLRTWMRAADGTEQLLGFGQAGLGALCLGHIEPLFSMKDQENDLLAQMRSTGLALSTQHSVLSIVAPISVSW